MGKFKRLGILVALIAIFAFVLVPTSLHLYDSLTPEAIKTWQEGRLSLGEIFDPKGNPFAHRFSDQKDIRTSTYVIAASDSKNRYDCDLRCNGADDDVQIQAAIDALPAVGGNVTLLEGNYDIAASVDLVSNLVLDLGVAQLTLANGVNSTMLDADAKSNIKILGGILEGNKLNQTSGHGISIFNASHDVEIDGVTVNNVYWFGIVFWDSYNGLVHHCTVDAPGGDGIVGHRTAAGDVYNLVISNNLVSNCDGTGGPVESYEGIACDDGAHDIVIEGNVIWDSDEGIDIATHSGLPACYNITIADNIITNVVYLGIGVGVDAAATTRGRNIIIEGNIIDTHTNDNAISVTGGVDEVTIANNQLRSVNVGILSNQANTDKPTNLKVRGNLIQTTTGRGIHLLNSEDVEVEGNTVDGTGSTGIQLENITRAKVTGNIVLSATGSGMHIQSCPEIVIGDNLVDTTAGDGITWQNCHYASVSGNVVRNSSSEGLFAWDSDYCSITGNVSYDDQGTVTQVAGLRLRGTNCTVTGNFIFGSEQQGIQVQRDDCVVVGNTLYDNGVDGIIVSADRALIADNKLTSNGGDGLDITADADDTRVRSNYYYGNGGAPVLDAGTNTIALSVVVPFVDGTDPLDSGYLIDANAELTRAFLFLPGEVQQVRFMKIYARSVVTEADAMRLEINVNGGADNEAYTTHATAAPNTASTSTNFAADDVIYWTLSVANILALTAGDSIEVKVLHEVAANGDCETDAYIRTVEIGYF